MSLEGKVAANGVVRGKINDLDVICIDAYGVAVKNGFKGTVEEWLESLKGEPGSGGASDAKDVFYDGADEYINATNVEEALKKTSYAIIGMIGDIGNKANYSHTHDASDVNKIVFVDGELSPVAKNVSEAIDYLVGQVGDVSRAFDELHAYAQALISGGGTE